MKRTITFNDTWKIVINNGGTISAITSTGLEYVFKLLHNKTYPLKINKTTISTCSTDMLVYLLENNGNAFIEVYTHITSGECLKDSIGYKVTKPEFYNMFNDNLDNLVTFFNNACHETRQIIIYDHCCTRHTAKMSGMISYSTLVLFNKFCAARMKKDIAVCSHCFAARQLDIYADELKKLARAHVIATMCKWSIDDIPAIDSTIYPFFRLESFGDINNTLQVENYNTLADVLFNKCGIRTTLWSKNPGIIQATINNGLVLSDGLTIGLSSLELNKPEIEKAKKYRFIKFVFTVYTPEYVTAHNITINCGGRHCLSCLNCYLAAATSDNLIVINELLK